MGRARTEFQNQISKHQKSNQNITQVRERIRSNEDHKEELGKTEKYRGEDVYTCMVFAEKILDLAKQAKIDRMTSGLWNVRDELPEVLHKNVPENQPSWTAFTQAIKDVDMGHIREGVRKYKNRTTNEA